MNSLTIAAIATPPGRGGIGIIRISGSKVPEIAREILSVIPQVRTAHYASFLAEDGSCLDQGIALYFPAPHSFTGEHVLELQGHGGPVILDQLLKRVLQLGAHLAGPGEFSERAFLNGKLDLAQAEAVADLIAAQSSSAARSALRSLQGEFSSRINQLVESLTHLRMYVEAAIDFAEEEIDFLADETIQHSLQNILKTLMAVEESARQGALLQVGATVVIAGPPNVGKSSLINQLSGQDTAIVTDIPGTTRDVLRVTINLDGLPLHIIDTAGLRESDDRVEQEGIRRAHQEIAKADCILLLTDCPAALSPTPSLNFDLPAKPCLRICNKIDLLNELPELTQTTSGEWTVKLSAKTGAGIDLLRSHLKTLLGYNNDCETPFSARRRHLEALIEAKQHLLAGQRQLNDYRAGELLAEELRLAQNALAEITGKFVPDDLLGRIFSSFCVGK